MPVIVVGADTEVGQAIISAVVPNAAETRAFISDPAVSDELKRLGVKVASGDVSDASHVEGAATRCFCAVLVTDAARDDRVRAFADNPETVYAGWADAVRQAGVQRVIWVAPGHQHSDLPGSSGEVAMVDSIRGLDAVAEEVADLEGRLTLG